MIATHLSEHFYPLKRGQIGETVGKPLCIGVRGLMYHDPGLHNKDVLAMFKQGGVADSFFGN